MIWRGSNISNTRVEGIDGFIYVYFLSIRFAILVIDKIRLLDQFIYSLLSYDFIRTSMNDKFNVFGFSCIRKKSFRVILDLLIISFLYSRIAYFLYPECRALCSEWIMSYRIRFINNRLFWYCSNLFLCIQNLMKFKSNRAWAREICSCCHIKSFWNVSISRDLYVNSRNLMRMN